MSSLERHEMGPEGYCYCTKCDYKTKHKRGVPCQDERCPKCGAKLIREGSFHDGLIKKKKEKKD